MNTDRTHRALSLAMLAVLTVVMLAGIDALATTQHAGGELMARTPAASAPQS